MKNKKLFFELLARSLKIKSHFQLLTRWLNFYLFTFELLARTWKILNCTSSYWPNAGWYWKFFFLYPLTVTKRKLVYFFGQPLNQTLNHKQSLLISVLSYCCSCRCVTRNFLGQGSFLGIRALRLTFIYNKWKKGTAGKKYLAFLPGNS